MRKDHYTRPVKWTREFRTAIKLGDVHFKVYAYLESAPESHATGLYFITVSAIAEMVREDRDIVASILDDLDRCGLALWDQEASVVYVPCVCAEQFRWKDDGKPKESDKRVLEAKSHLRNLPATRLLAAFLARWPVFDEGAYQGASYGASGFGGETAKPLNTQGQEGAYQGAWQGATTSPSAAIPDQDAPDAPIRLEVAR